MKYPPYASRSNLIAKAASFTRGDKLGRLYILCDKQKTISTRKLERILNDMADDLRCDAIFLKEIYKLLPNNKVDDE
jgi:hypothetical protein